jgi:hypothetical protein
VFDCGSKSKRDYLDRELQWFARRLSGRRIRLFCISHFDEDHINGARYLLQKQHVNTLILPYFPLVERIQIAITPPRPSHDYLRFLVDPAGYLFGVAGDNLDQIIFIMGGQSPADPQTPGPEGVSPDDWSLDFPDPKQPDGVSDEDLHGVSDPLAAPNVLVVDHSQPFTVSGVWEFVFYNEFSPEDRLRPLRDSVVNILRSHKKSDGSFNAKQMLPELTELYSAHLGGSAKEKNRISLVLYAGPLLSSGINGCRSSGYITIPSYSSWWHGWNRPRFGLYKFSTLYTGDFLLTSMPKLQAMRAHFDAQRWTRIAVMQIPHHGSKGAWFPGAGDHFQHELSVFSSRRASPSFPARTVIDDLQERTPIFVNEYQRFASSGYLEVP